MKKSPGTSYRLPSVWRETGLNKEETRRSREMQHCEAFLEITASTFTLASLNK